MAEVITVSALNRYVKSLFDANDRLFDLALRGEVANFVQNARSGHCYFTLRDEQASVKAVMFRSDARRLAFRPEEGMRVVVRCRATLYERDGAFQLYVNEMFPDGIGAAQLALEQLKARLEQEGLFDAAHKKPLPQYPRCIGLVTSKTGAALQDIRNVISRRWPGIRLLLCPVMVQGFEAAPQIAAAIRTLDRSGRADVIIVARGGGSREDLWVFNAEVIARAAFACKTPLISAIGHEIDYTILDFVADQRAPTPSAAAELAVPDREEQWNILQNLQQNISENMQKRLKLCYNELEQYNLALERKPAHHIWKRDFDQLEQAGNPYVDATCPFVAKIHRIVEEHTRAGDFILIAGDANHPEVAAIVGHCKGNCFVFESEEALNNFFQKNLVNSRKRLAIVAQTTYNILVWEKCLEALPKDNPNIMVYDTICHATQVRQSDADKLSRKSDLMIIVGGRHSSNTVKLYHVCNRNCRSYHIENSDELYTLDLGNAEKIGITAGASTPAHIIKEVQQTMTEIMDNNAVEEDINFAEALDQSFKKIHTGEKVKGTVCSVNDSEAIVDVGTKHTGYVPRSELTDDASKKPSDVVAVGDVLDLIVTKINDQEGIVTLSKKKVDEMKGFEEIIKAKDEEAVLEGTVSASVKGGVIINYAGVRVFIPAS